MLPKPSKDHRYLKNWRPIALLNSDYKIASKSMALRMKSILSHIISFNQTGFLKGRYIGENVRLILDIINYCDQKSIQGALLFLDFEKAFDSLDWNFLRNCLSYFNFGQSFCKWVELFYSNATSCVINNGFTSNYFRLFRGVRQGCPLSPYLFITCTEILHSLITYNDNILGLYISNVHFKITQYADDTVIITDGSNESLLETKYTLDLFYKISGLKINYSKSHIFGLGPFASEVPHYFGRLGFSICIDTITYLGISFTHHHDDFFSLNYLPKLSRIKNLLLSWSTRDLTPIGRVHIIKSFAISQIVYLLSVLPNPPDSFFKELNSLLFKFIWGRKNEKVNREVVCTDKSNGGLNMINMKYFADGLKCKWVKLYLEDSDRNWKAIFDNALHNYGGDFLFRCNFSKGDVLISSLFIQHVCDACMGFIQFSCT